MLSALNTALREDPTAGTRFCTAIYGLLDPRDDPRGGGGFTVTLAAGGHPPAYHLGRDPAGGVRAQAVDTRGGMLIGALAQPRSVSGTVTLAPGEALLLYTDGLTEARTRDGGLFDLEGLDAFLTRRSGPIAATALVADVVALLEALPGELGDDVALLALSAPRGPALGP